LPSLPSQQQNNREFFGSVRRPSIEFGAFVRWPQASGARARRVGRASQPASPSGSTNCLTFSGSLFNPAPESGNYIDIDDTSANDIPRFAPDLGEAGDATQLTPTQQR
jgi:hypothetical protein